MIINTIIAVVVIFIVLSISGWVAAFLARKTPFIYFFIGIMIPVNKHPDIEYNKIIVIIFSLLWAYKLLVTAQKRILDNQALSHVPNTVNISMSGFITGCLLSTCFNIFIYFFPNIF